MNIISFAWTTPAVKAKVKTCTRRDWKDDYARRFKAGQHLSGYDKNPRMGGKPFQEVILTQDPYRERYCDVPDSDWIAEGFAYLESIGSEAYMAVKLGRKATLIELKPEYFNVAVANLRKAEAQTKVIDMFSLEKQP